jgi:hypothetical protein
MSVTGVPGINNSQVSTQTYQDTLQEMKTEFQQLRTGLQAGNLSQARQDFTTPSQNISGSQQSNVHQDFSALGQALKSGNLSDAQNAYSTLLQDLQQASSQVHHHHHHHAPGSQGADSSDGQQSNPIAKAFDALGKALELGDLSAAQQAYLKIQQDLQQYGLNVSAVSSSSAAAQTPGSNLNVTT